MEPDESKRGIQFQLNYVKNQHLGFLTCIIKKLRVRHENLNYVMVYIYLFVSVSKGNVLHA